MRRPLPRLDSCGPPRTTKEDPPVSDYVLQMPKRPIRGKTCLPFILHESTITPGVGRNHLYPSALHDVSWKSLDIESSVNLS